MALTSAQKQELEHQLNTYEACIQNCDWRGDAEQMTHWYMAQRAVLEALKVLGIKARYKTESLTYEWEIVE
jgi:hypothetical protein